MLWLVSSVVHAHLLLPPQVAYLDIRLNLQSHRTPISLKGFNAVQTVVAYHTNSCCVLKIGTSCILGKQLDTSEDGQRL